MIGKSTLIFHIYICPQFGRRNLRAMPAVLEELPAAPALQTP